jgi:hypothetical protein
MEGEVRENKDLEGKRAVSNKRTQEIVGSSRFILQKSKTLRFFCQIVTITLEIVSI